MTHQQAFGALSTFMMLLSRTNYFNSIFQGRTRPHAFSWLIWGTISSVGFAAQVAEGAGAGAWARGLACITSFMIVIIALFKGEKDIKRSDWFTLAAALFTIPLWIATKTPVWSVILVCLIDTIGFMPTLRKSWIKPHEEAARSYTFSGLGAMFSLAAIEHYTVSTWLYTFWLVFSNIGMAVFLVWRRRQLKQA